MDRQIVYVGAIPMDTDILLQNRSNMVALGYLAKAILGDTGVSVDGLQCSPGAGLTVIIGPGSVFSPMTIDASYYGTLPPDGDPLVKVGVNTSSTTLAVPAGQTSIIAAAFNESLGGQSVIAYYNPANPAQTMLGPSANGQSQATVLTQRVSLSVSTADAVQTGYTPLWQVTVPLDAVAISPSMISAVPGAPFIVTKLPAAAPISSPAFSGTPTAPTSFAGDASPSLATTGFVARALIPNRAAWGTAGTYTWTCPVGVSNVLARLWAAGGRGGAASSGPGGGGGGGGYLEALITVTPGHAYSVQVGGSGSDRRSLFDTLLSVSGGVDGGSGNGSTGGTGGSAGTAMSGSFNLVAALGVTGGDTGFFFAGNPVGGSGGSSFGAAASGPCFGTAPAGGVWPGGGGSGAVAGSGAPGADGLVILEWRG